jgi:hypothetical protein
MIARLSAVALTLAPLAAAASPGRSVAVLEYRAGAKGASGVADQLARLLRATASLEVVDPPEARRRVGPQVDAEVARCSGDPACIGGLGRRLRVDEVLLVGVSQLGDIVLLIQRVEAQAAVVTARMAASLPEGGEPSDADALGWLQQLYPPEVFRRYGAIVVVSDEIGAEVSLNGAPAGTTPLAQPVRVRAPGSYHVRIEKRGYLPFQAKIDVLPDATVEVRASLALRNGPLPWWRRWYVWAAIGAVAAGAAASVAIYYGTRVDQTPLGYIDTPPH